MWYLHGNEIIKFYIFIGMKKIYLTHKIIMGNLVITHLKL